MWIDHGAVPPAAATTACFRQDPVWQHEPRPSHCTPCHHTARLHTRPQPVASTQHCMSALLRSNPTQMSGWFMSATGKGNSDREPVWTAQLWDQKMPVPQHTEKRLHVYGQAHTHHERVLSWQHAGSDRIKSCLKADSK